MRQQLASVEYTVTSRGRPIGTTDLGFARLDDSWRAGWFLPNERAADVMAALGAVLPATLAVHPKRGRTHDNPAVARRELARSTEWADLAEALHRVDELDLELRCADGSVVPTESIEIQDTESLLELVEADDAGVDLDWWRRDEAHELPFEPEADLEYEADGYMDAGFNGFDANPDGGFVDDLCADDAGWTPESRDTDLPRYQIFIMLSRPGAIP